MPGKSLFRLGTAVAFALAAGVAQAAEVAKTLSPAKISRAPDLSVRDSKGDVRRLEEYRGQTVVLNFWATWCEPCLAEMPSLEDLERRLSGKPFKVLAVNFAESEERVKAFLENYGIRLEVLYDKDMGAAKRWNARILPASFVIDPEGRVRYSVIGEADWTAGPIVAAIEKLLAEKGPRVSSR
jgi:cytochrome c biogenesis protein CcmG, thiol:disulfide interchange protein DsbE